MPVRRKATGKRHNMIVPPTVVPYNRPDTNLGGSPRKRADVGQVGLRRKRMSKTLEPKDKLDADTVPQGVVVANGPMDAAVDWNAVDWRAAEAEVRRLRQRIFAATRAGDYKRVRSLQKLMLRSRSSTLISVRQVTERNAGRFTAGIDGQVALTSLAKQELVADIQRSPHTARPVRRVHIPKANGKLRPLGIPVIFDRVQQTRVRQALEPEWL